MKKILRKPYALIALMAVLLLALALVACNGDATKNDTDNAYDPALEQYLSEDFIDHWLGFAAEEDFYRMVLQMEVLNVKDNNSDLDDTLFGVQGLDMYIIAARVDIDQMHATNREEKWCGLIHFVDEGSALAFNSSNGIEKIIGPDRGARTTVKGNVVYCEPTEGYVDDHIMKQQIDTARFSKTKLDFIHSALKDVKNESHGLYWVSWQGTKELFVDVFAAPKGNIAKMYSIAPDGADSSLEGDQYCISRVWYTDDNYVDTTREAEFSYKMIEEKPGFRYDIIKDEKGEPTDAIAVFGYFYDSPDGANMVIPSYIDGHPVEEVSTMYYYNNIGYGLISNGLKSIKLPATMKKFNFDGTDVQIEKIEVEDGNPYYHVDGNCLIETATDKLIWACKGAVIPTYVKEIGTYAFFGHHSGAIDIPVSVKKIAPRAFEYDLTELNYQGTTDQFKEIDFYYRSLEESIITVKCTNGTLTIDHDGIRES